MEFEDTTAWDGSECLDELASLLAGCTVDAKSADGDDKKCIVVTDKDCMDLLDRIEASAQKELTEGIHDHYIKAQMDERKLMHLLTKFKKNEELSIKGNNILEIIPDYSAGLDRWYREDVEAKIMVLYDDKKDFSNAIFVFRASGDPKAPDWLHMAPVRECTVQYTEGTMERTRGSATKKNRMFLYKYTIPGVVGDATCTFELTWAVRKSATRFLPKWLTNYRDTLPTNAIPH